MPEDDDKKEEEAIFRVDTIPPPEGQSDAYSAPTKVGPMAESVMKEMIVAATTKAAELAQRNAEKAKAREAKPDPPPPAPPPAPPPDEELSAGDLVEDEAPPRLYAEDDDDYVATLLHKQAAPPPVLPQPRRRTNTDPLPPSPVLQVVAPSAPQAPSAPPLPRVPPSGEQARPVPIMPLVAGATIFLIGVLLYAFLR